MNVSDLIVSYIRTGVPVLIGIALTFLGKNLGILEPPPEVVPWVVGACVAAYYALARLLEAKWPILGVLLGAPKPPTYRAPVE